jgi:polyphosphate kinase
MTETKVKYFDRELSWLSFNARVLQESSDPSNPLIERLKFLGIYSNNQDEFYRVRVATIRRLADLEDHTPDEIEKSYRETLDLVKSEVKRQQKIFVDTYESLLRELRKQNIWIINEDELDEEQGQFVREYFREKVRPFLFPIMLKYLKNTELLTDYSIYLAVMLGRSDAPEKDAMAMVEIPTQSVSRFLLLPEKEGRKFIILLDDIIRYCLDEIFARFKFDHYKAFTFKFTRDAELDIDNDVSKSFLELVTESLAQRKKGTAVRFVYDKEMPNEVLQTLLNKLKISSRDNVVEGGRYHNFKDLMAFPNLGRSELAYPKFPPVLHRDIPVGSSIIKAIRNKDIMLHYPYHSFQHIVDLLREASIDPKVRSIKMTIYRVSNPSNIMNALINAARNGKFVTVFMELQARFDEETNIFWAGKLQEAGVKVLHGIKGLKVHCKIILIKRKELNEYRSYANIGTGNFHEKTGGLYCDEALLTANPLITSEVDKVFDLFETAFKPPRFRTIVVSPFSTRNFFLKMINNEIVNARAGKEAWAIIKLNSLADVRLINKLYQASQEGVKLQLIVRGICKLVPGVPGMSENIHVVSILDKYLEHSRVHIFHNGGNERYFISSADWMIRNLDTRIEVTTPIFDPDIQKELKDMLNIQLSDNKKARVIDSKMSNMYYRNKKEPVRAQVDIYNYLKRVHQPNIE